MKAPPAPVAPLRLIPPSVTTGSWLSSVALAVSPVVVTFPASSVALTATFKFEPSILPATIVYVVVEPGVAEVTPSDLVIVR